MRPQLSMREQCLHMVHLCRKIAFLGDFESEVVFEACRLEVVVSGIHWRSLDKWVASLFKGTADRVGSLGGTLLDELKETKVEEPRKTKVQRESRGKADDAQEREWGGWPRNWTNREKGIWPGSGQIMWEQGLIPQSVCALLRILQVQQRVLPCVAHRASAELCILRNTALHQCSPSVLHPVIRCKPMYF